ncbi:HD domain-containing protein [Dyadobacter fermentans]|uniref:Metal dependent phosphohydrolase n=1 Tax=Dyadobacter fermentans (strain ATCC 700827 / DSM 18053 / CIP 107007 / KCTC 52180 / NS114) TaxID=471854 RepID=C6W4Z8_DYAFD|nr:HD domain-containing protein [Dyadobacter fermentans]ACT92358.1 metal dependent phosphohydrolase [Dyadobacter fermentans DSM 18053]
MRIEKAEQYVLGQLESRLDRTLFYHGIHHTLDVVAASAEIAALEGITDSESLALLRTAALYHDSGFLTAYQGHEEAGCALAREVLADFGYNARQIETICGMIMATKIPQSPQNTLEKIICDADLDYLGRADFEAIAATLFEELKVRDMVEDIPAWDAVQVKFLEAHSYWTASQQKRRDAAKQRHLQHLKNSPRAL